MDDKKIDDDYELSSAHVREFTNSINSSNTGLTIEEQALAIAKKAIVDKKERDKQIEQFTESSITGLLNFGRTLSAQGSSGGFGGLNAAIDAVAGVMSGMASSIPLIGAAVEEVVKGAAELGKFLVNQFKKAYGNFEKLSDTGVVGKFEEIKEISDTTGLNLDDASKVFGKFSREMALFGGSANNGRKIIQNVNIQAEESSRSFQILGITIDQVAEFQIGSLLQNRYSANFDVRNTKKNAEFAVTYTKNLDSLSKLTGKGRKALQEEIYARQKNARYNAGIATLDIDIKTQVDNAITLAGTKGELFATTLTDLIANNGVAIEKDVKILLQNLEQGGMNTQADIQALRRGTLSGMEFNRRVTNAMARYNKDINSTVALNTDLIDQYKFANAAQNAAQEALTNKTKSQEEVDDAQKLLLELEKGQGFDLANSRRQFYGASKNIEMLALTSDLVTSAMNMTAKAINKSTKIIYNAIGKKIPADIKARMDEVDAIEALNANKVLLNNALDRFNEKKAEIEELKKDPVKNAIKIRSLMSKQKLDENQSKLLNSQIKKEEADLKILKEDRKKKENLKIYGNEHGPGGVPPVSGTTAGNTSGTTAGNTSGTTAGNTSGTTVGNTSGTTVGNTNESSSGSSGKLNKELAEAAALVPTREVVEGGKPLPSPQKEFYDRMYTSIYAAALLAKLTNPEAVARLGTAQTAIETGWGKHAPGNNYFGIKARPGDTGPGQQTQEFINGKMVTITAGFRRYESMEESAVDYIKFLKENSRYKDVLNAATVKDAIQAQAKSGYATDPNYGSKLTSINAMGMATPVTPKARTGGKFSGPSTGYTAILHGDEIVIPANEGSQKLQLQGMMGDQINNDSIINLFTMLNNKFDGMIRAAESMITTQTTAKMFNV